MTFAFLTEVHRCAANGRLSPELLDKISEVERAAHECEVLDFKLKIPEGDAEYAKTARDLIALHNSYGGFLVFGIGEVEKDRGFVVNGVVREALQLNKLRDICRAYTGSDMRINAAGLMISDQYVETIWIAKRGQGEQPVRFTRNGPDEKPGKPSFKKGQVVFRRIESNAIATDAEDYDFLHSSRRPPSLDLPSATHASVDPLENNLPDRAAICANFIGRKDDLGDLWAWLTDDFSRVRLIAATGGLGKTSLAYTFAEFIATRRAKPFEKVVWLSAKERQFVPATNQYREISRVDFHDATSMYQAIARALGGVESDFDGLDSRDVMRLALEHCAAIPSFIVIDDVDSLATEDQLRALEFGMRAPAGVKLLLTTRVNFSYSPDNVLNLGGLPEEDFRTYVIFLRERYQLAPVTAMKISKLHGLSGGSPLFADSIIRLERRGVTIDQAIGQWKGQQGVEVRKAALQREVQQLSVAAKRVLYVISILRNTSYVELSQIVDYAEQTLGDAIQELSGLFLISAPAISREPRFTVDPNTASLVKELVDSLGIDHAALAATTKRSKPDAVGISTHKRSQLVGLAISEAMAELKAGDAKAALEVIRAAQKKTTKPHPDLLLASGRFNIALAAPNFDEASKQLEQAYSLGLRKPLLFELWFQAECGRGLYEQARDIAAMALENGPPDSSAWFERRAQTHVYLSHRARSSVSNHPALRELDLAIADLREAKAKSSSSIDKHRYDIMLEEALNRKKSL